MTTKYGRLLRVREVAEALGLSPGRVYELIEAREITAVKVARSVYVTEKDLDAWIEAHRVPAVQKAVRPRAERRRSANIDDLIDERRFG